MKIKFIKAKLDDLKSVIVLYKSVTQNMIENGLFQWDEHYPNEELISYDVQNSKLYIGKNDDKIACAFVLNNFYDDEYKNGEWINKSEPYLVLHRLCVSPNFQHKGMGNKALTFAEELCRKNNCRSLRLDTFTENAVAVRLYKSNGYKIVGEALWCKGRFYLMEKCFNTKHK